MQLLEKQKTENPNKQLLQFRKKVIAGVPKGSIDGPLSFASFIDNLVFFLTHCLLGSYSEDKNLYSTGKNLEKKSVQMRYIFAQWQKA